MPYKDVTKRREVQAAYRLRNTEKIREWKKDWAKENPDKLKASSARWSEKYPGRRARSSHRSFVKRAYGLTLEQVDVMLIAQSGRCALCGDPMKRPCVDHDHTSGAVRALLCFSCNVAIGHLKDDPSLCERAAQYLRSGYT